MQKILYKHDGLVQEVSNSITSSHNEICNTKFRFTLPVILTPLFWTRHGYSLTDIKTTLKCMYPKIVVQVARLLGVPLSHRRILISFATPTSIIFHGKDIIVKHIIKSLSNQFQDGVSVLDTVRTDHVPPLPLHIVPKPDYDRILSIVPKSPPSPFIVNEYKYSYNFKGADMVPYEIEQNAIYMIRIIPENVFLASRRIAKVTLANKPLNIRIDHKMYCGIIDDCCLLECG